eukprot:47799_1
MAIKYSAIGHPISEFPTVFSDDGKLLFCCAANDIRIYSVKNGELIGVLRGHTDKVLGLVLNPQNHLQLISAGLDNTVRVWSLDNCSLLHTHSEFEGNSSITHMARRTLSEKRTVRVVLCMTSSVGKSGQRKIISLDVRSGTTEDLFEVKFCDDLEISPNGKQIVVASKRRIYVYTRASSDLTYHAMAVNVTCVAFHPVKPYVAAGDSGGRITMWYPETSQSGGRTVTSTLHWHAHGVMALAFSEDGSYLLSGGEEAVLVMWQLDTGHKQFLPRLGAHIRAISVDSRGALYALSSADNALRLVSAVGHKVQRKIAGLRLAVTPSHARADYVGVGLRREPNSNLLVLNGGPGSLQFYDVNEDRSRGSLQVVAYNAISRAQSAHLHEPRVTHAEFSAHGDWLVTVERRPLNFGESASAKKGGGFRARTQTLKFWHFDESERKFMVRTTVDQPHQAEIESVAFHPTKDFVLTVSRADTDAAFKTWELRAAARAPSDVNSRIRPVAPAAWHCRAAGAYRASLQNSKKGRADKSGACAFSEDGSLMAVSFGPVITMWDPFTLTLLKTLVHPTGYEGIRFLSFVPSTSFLVAASAVQLYVWDMLTARAHWAKPLRVRCMALEARGACVAVLAEKDGSGKSKKRSGKNPHELLLFSMKSPEPLGRWDVPAPLYSQSNLMEILPHSAQNANTVVYLGSARQLVRTHLVHSEDGAVTVAASVAVSGGSKRGKRVRAEPNENEQNTSLFKRLYGANILPVAKKQRIERFVETSDSSAAISLFDAPSHVLPPLDSLFTAFADALVAKVDRSQLEPPSPIVSESCSSPKVSKHKATNEKNSEARSFESASSVDHFGMPFPELALMFQNRYKSAAKSKVLSPHKSSRINGLKTPESQLLLKKSSGSAKRKSRRENGDISIVKS